MREQQRGTWPERGRNRRSTSNTGFHPGSRSWSIPGEVVPSAPRRQWRRSPVVLFQAHLVAFPARAPRSQEHDSAIRWAKEIAVPSRLNSAFFSQLPSSSHVVFLLLVVKSNTIAMPNCFFPLTSQPKARVSMLGSTLEAESMMLRGSLHALDRS